VRCDGHVHAPRRSFRVQKYIGLYTRDDRLWGNMRRCGTFPSCNSRTATGGPVASLAELAITFRLSPSFLSPDVAALLLPKLVAAHRWRRGERELDALRNDVKIIVGAFKSI